MIIHVDLLDHWSDLVPNVQVSAPSESAAALRHAPAAVGIEDADGLRGLQLALDLDVMLVRTANQIHPHAQLCVGGL